MSKIIITVEGGMVQSIMSDDQTISAHVLDLDNMKDCDIEPSELEYYQGLNKEVKKLTVDLYNN